MLTFITVANFKGKRTNKVRKLVKELIEGGDNSDKINKSNVNPLTTNKRLNYFNVLE